MESDNIWSDISKDLPKPKIRYTGINYIDFILAGSSTILFMIVVNAILLSIIYVYTTDTSSTTSTTTKPLPSLVIKVTETRLVVIQSVLATSTTTTTGKSSTTIRRGATTTRPRYGYKSVPICNNILAPNNIPGVNCSYGESSCISYGEACGSDAIRYWNGCERI